MTDDGWHARWSEGRIGFHLEHVNPDLVRWLPRLVSGPARVLVPLCGKSVDLAYLADQGHEVVGVELVEEPVVAFFEERGLDAAPEQEGGHAVYRAAGIELHVADMLAVRAADLGEVTAIYDRAALIALPKETRKAYAKRMVELLPPGGRMLLVTLAYDQARMDGPPYSVSDDEVRALYGDAGQLEQLAHDPSTNAPPRAQELGLVMSSSTWLLTRR